MDRGLVGNLLIGMVDMIGHREVEIGFLLSRHTMVVKGLCLQPLKEPERKI